MKPRRLTALLITAFLLLLAACADEETRRTALDPPTSDDRAVRQLASDLVAATEDCDFARISEIVGAEVVLEKVSEDDPSGLEPLYYMLTHCEMRLDYDRIDIGHAFYDHYPGHPDAISVSVSGRLRGIEPERTEWREFDSKYYFDKAEDGSWRLVSDWLPG